MDTSITRAEHEEFRKRIEEENKRQNCRINKLEDTFEMINSLATLTEKLATSMECKRRRLGVSKYWRSATARSGERSWATYLPPLLE